MNDNEAEVEDQDHGDVPPDLVELHEVAEWLSAVGEDKV